MLVFEELLLLWKASDKTVNIWRSRSSNSRWSFLLILPSVLDRPSIFLPRTTSCVVTMNSSDVPPLCGTDDNNVKTVFCHKKKGVFEYTKTIRFFTPDKKGCF